MGARLRGAFSSASNCSILSTTQAILSPSEASVPAGNDLRPKQAAFRSAAHPMSLLGHGLPSRRRCNYDRCTPDSCRLAAPRKSAESGHVWTAPGWQELCSRVQQWSEQPCVRPVSAVHVTAGHNALRGSGPGQFHAFDHAVARVGCPDRRIDRLCITCCSPLPTVHITLAVLT